MEKEVIKNESNQIITKEAIIENKVKEVKEEITEKTLEENQESKKNIIIAVKVAIALLVGIFSLAYISKVAQSPEFHTSTIQTLQTKQENVLKLSAATATTAAGASLLLGDRANAVSNKLLDLSGYFLIILCAIMLEKYLVTIMGFTAFKIIIPIACIIFSVFTIVDRESMRKLSYRLVVFALATFLVIPLSVSLSNVIEETYKEANIQNVIAESENIIKEIETTNENENNTSNTSNHLQNESKNKKTDEVIEEKNEIKNNDETGILGAISNFVTNAGNSIADTAVKAKDTVVTQAGNVFNAVKDKANEMINKLTKLLNSTIETIAVMLVTTCVIPILVIMFFLWMIKMIFLIEINVDPKQLPKLSTFKKK